MSDTTNTAPWAGIKLTPKQIKDVLEKHAKWLRGEEGGESANLRDVDLRYVNLRGADLRYANLRDAHLRYADLRGADLESANLRDADLGGAELRYANLRGAELRYANLRGADLERANLRDADLWYVNLRGAELRDAHLRYADLRGADLERAHLRDADLRDANLVGADLRDANLLCCGNMREIRTMQIGKWEICYTSDTLQIGCQRHTINKWRKWDTDASRKWIAQMDPNALEWADRNLGLILQIIDANPATPTGHEAKDHTND